MRRTKAGRTYKKIALLLAVIIAAGTICAVWRPVEKAKAALFDETQCNTFGYYRQSHTIPDGTLLYGIYLMSVSSLSDTVMERAAESAAASGQDSMYYKSELANGQWYKIDGAEGISAITAGGELVEESSLDNLYIKYYVEPNGTVKDLIVQKKVVLDYFETKTYTRGWGWWKKKYKITFPVFKIIDITDFTANIYDYPAPYNKCQMEEFTPLNEIMDTYLTKDNDKDQGHYNYTEVGKFLKTWPTDSVTELDDIILNNTAYVQSVLYGSGSEIESEMANILYKFSDSTDAHRRVQYLENVLNVPLRTADKRYTLFGWLWWNHVWSFLDTSKYTVAQKASEFPEVYYKNAKQWAYFGGMSALEKWVLCDADAVCTTAIGETAQNISDSINNYSTKIISDPEDTETSTEIAKDKYELYGKISAVIASDPQEMSGGRYTWYDDLYHYLMLHHIEQSIVARKDDELALLGDEDGLAKSDGLLIGRVTDKYRNKLFAGAGEPYYTIQAQGANEQVLKNELADEAETIEAFRAELQFVIKARLDRIPARTRRVYLDNRLDYTNSMLDVFMNTMSEDPQYANAVLSIKKHIKWLSAELAIALGQDDETSELERLIAVKQELQERYLGALDEDDLTEAEIIEATITDIDDQIEKEIASYTDVEPGPTYEDKAIESKLGTIGGLIERLTNKVIDDLDEGKTESESLTALVMIGATDALNELKTVFAGNDTFDKAIKNAEDEFKESGLTLANSLTDRNNIPGGGTQGQSGSGPDNLTPGGETASGDHESGQNQSGSDGAPGNGSQGDGPDSQSGKQRIIAGLSGKRDPSDSKNEGSITGDPKTDKLLGELDNIDGIRGVTTDEIEDVIEDTLGDRSSGLSADGKIIAAVATGILGDQGYADARNISQSLMSRCVQENNKYAYKTYIGSDGTAYVSLKTIDRISDFRYDFKQNDYTMENVGAGQIYHYAMNSKDVWMSSTSKVQMDALPAEYDGVVYIIGSESELHYGVTAEPVTNTGYSGALTVYMEDKKNQLLKALIEAIEEKNQQNQ